MDKVQKKTVLHITTRHRHKPSNFDEVGINLTHVSFYKLVKLKSYRPESFWRNRIIKLTRTFWHFLSSYKLAVLPKCYVVLKFVDEGQCPKMCIILSHISLKWAGITQSVKWLTVEWMTGVRFPARSFLFVTKSRLAVMSAWSRNQGILDILRGKSGRIVKVTAHLGLKWVYRCCFVVRPVVVCKSGQMCLYCFKIFVTLFSHKAAGTVGTSLEHLQGLCCCPATTLGHERCSKFLS